MYLKPFVTRMKTTAIAASIVVAASFGGTSGAVQADDIKDWRVKVVKQIAKRHIYPRSAISREIEGRARVRVTLARSGEITNFEVIEPTGESILDKTIPKMMEKLNPLPAPPDALSDDKLTFVIPITWRLQ
jgi:protein TonB